MPKLKHLAIVAALVAVQGVAAVAEPVRRIAIYVEPFYRAADSPDGRPTVAVGEPFSAMLASNRREDILAARDRVVADPRVITPMTMMVLAIRLYDMGLRDDAVFWFYAAKYRYAVLAGMVDTNAAVLAEAGQAVRAFATLAGPVINGYAFCDPAEQAQINDKAIDWVESHPYQAMFIARLPALPGDRQENLKRAFAKFRQDAAQARAYLADAKNQAAFEATRKANQADIRFCWR
jgi:hypothetical protein